MVHTFPCSPQGTEVSRSLCSGAQSAAVINHSDQKQCREERDSFGFHFQVTAHHRCSEGRKLKQKPLRNNVCWLTPGLLMLSRLPYTAQYQMTRGWYCPSRLVFLCQLIIKTPPLDTPTEQPDGDSYSTKTLFIRQFLAVSSR